MYWHTYGLSSIAMQDGFEALSVFFTICDIYLLLILVN